MKPLVSVEELHKLMPNLNDGRARMYAPLLCAAMEEFDITSKRRRCAFLAQLAHESVELRYMEEIASGQAYEGRSDLGNTHPGDGKRYKGRGPIQLTGRANYRRFGKILDLDLEAKPALAAVPEHGFRIAALFWKLGGLNELADQLTMKGDAAERKTFTAITRRINGGTNGLTDRLNYFRVAKQVLHNDEDPDPSSPSQAPVAPPAVRPAESVAEQEPASQAENAALVSAEQAGPDLLGAAVPKAKAVAPKLWPRITKHAGAAATWLYALYEANKFGFIVIVLVVIGGLLWLVYHNRKKLAPQIVKWLK